MGKKPKGVSRGTEEEAKLSLSGDQDAFDPALSSLFATSLGPVKVPAKPVIKAEAATKSKRPAVDLPTPDETSTEPSEAESEPEVDVGLSEKASPDAKANSGLERSRKRRKLDDDDLEEEYFRKLAKEEERDLEQQENQDDRQSERSESPTNDLPDLSDDDEPNPAADALPVHESLSGTAKASKEDIDSRTVFLSNVCTTAIKSKSAKKTLLAHLETALPPSTKIESIRFRSTAYDRSAGPKKAAYATKALMDETASSTHAYVVVSTPSAAHALTKLNGKVILDRHLHIDHLGSPAPIVHRRCVFVGNLPFVDEETLPTPDEENPRQRPKAKQRSDPEEGLWRTFAKAGTVENVRMVRDRATRIGKGFAYVQFTDENAVEKALLMNDKKYPPLLPRKLRVMRAKKPAAKPKVLDARRRGGVKDNASASGKDSGRRGKAVQSNRGREAGKRKQFGGSRGHENKLGKDVVFEGYRASATTSSKFKTAPGGKKRKQTQKPTDRSARRAAAFKAGGGKKKRDVKK